MAGLSAAAVVGLCAGDAAAWTDGKLVRGKGDARLRGVSIDTRQLKSGELFVAIRGPHHDAHAFLADAVRCGAAGLMIEPGCELAAELPERVAVVQVENTTDALGALARGWRGRASLPLVAITGSNGKTTTKEMCAAALAQAGPCHKNEGNLNNEYGLPLTLLGLRPEHEHAVVELGMNHRGEIARLANIARPTIGVLTNVGSAHIEHLGSRQAIAREKGDLLAALPASGTAVVNRDDPEAWSQAARAACPVLGFGCCAAADVRAEDVRQLPEGAFAFELHSPAGRAALRVPGLSETTVANALAASAAALAAGATLDQLATGLAGYRNLAGRMTRIDRPDGLTVIDDSYNANPQSMREALRALARLASPEHSVVVFGDMGELGAEADDAHRRLGESAAALPVRALFALGERAALVVEGAVAAGLARECAQAHASVEDTCDALRACLEPEDWVLVKGSRAMRMERIVRALASEKGD